MPLSLESSWSPSESSTTTATCAIASERARASSKRRCQRRGQALRQRRAEPYTHGLNVDHMSREVIAPMHQPRFLREMPRVLKTQRRMLGGEARDDCSDPPGTMATCRFCAARAFAVMRVQAGLHITRVADICPLRITHAAQQVAVVHSSGVKGTGKSCSGGAREGSTASSRAPTPYAEKGGPFAARNDLWPCGPGKLQGMAARCAGGPQRQL